LPHPAPAPLWLKIVFSVFVAVLVPYYWHEYGPGNFLFFCDLSVLGTLAAIWLNSRLLASMQAVSILLLQTVWMLDFLCAGHLLNVAGYMFDSGIPLHVRGMSSFHIWLPPMLVWLLYRWGYDRRALIVQTAVGWMVLLACYFIAPEPGDPLPAGRPNYAFNINYVFGIGKQPQTWMPPLAWLGLLMAAFPIVLYVPTHLVLRWAFAHRPSGQINQEPVGDLPSQEITNPLIQGQQNPS
jgi:hypothetical protein